MNALRRLALAASLPLLTAAGSSSAAVVVHNDLATFQAITGATSATGAIPGSTITGGSRTFGTATFTAPYWVTGNVWSTVLGGNVIGISNGAGDTANPTPYYNDGIDVSFAAPVYAAGFWFHQPTQAGVGNLPDGCNVAVCIDSQFRITLLDGGDTVAAIDWTPLTDVAEFWGVASTLQFTSMRIRETVGTDDNEYYGEFFTATNAPATGGTVPEPTSLLLAGLGLFTLAANSRRPAARRR